MKNLKKIVALMGLLAPVSVQAFTPPTNLFLPDDSALKLPWLGHKHNKKHHKHDEKHHGRCKSFSFGLYDLEFGDRDNGKNWQGHRTNVLQIFDATQSSLFAVQSPTAATLAALPAATAASFNAIANYINVNTPFAGALGLDGALLAQQANFDTGEQLFTGKFEQFQATLFGSYKLPFKWFGKFGLALYVPIVEKKITNVNIQDLTAAGAVGSSVGQQVYSAMIDTLLAGSIKTDAQAFGNLNLNNWEKTGLGDIALMLEWDHCFGNRDGESWFGWSVFAKTGVYFPSSEKVDENRAFSMPLGNDGAWGMPFGLSLVMHGGNHVRLGVDGEVVVLFDETRTRRMKTDVNQTEFLLLNKGRATKEHGVTWEVHPYLQWRHFVCGLSAQISYQYFGHEKDKLKTSALGFTNAIVNTANSLKSSDIQNVIFKLNYDCPNKWFCSPQISAFYKLPVDGKGAIDCETWGFQFVINF